MSDGYNRMDEEKKIKKPEKATETDDIEIDEILSEDAATGRKKANLDFLEDENIYFAEEQDEMTNETEEVVMAGKKKGFFSRLSKPKKIAFSIGIGLLSLIILFVGVAGIYVLSKLAKIQDGKDIQKMSTEYQDPDYGEILFDVGSEGFRQALKDWATTGNGNHMDNRNVINILLIGADSRNGTNTGNTDVMMIVSLNKQTKEIKLVSLLRDSYLYVEGINRQSFTKLNAAFSMGGADCLVKTVENNYKIDIDNYVMVNFESFARIIDAMDGINLNISQAESDYSVKKFGISLPVGDNVKLNGKQALCFCRIRAIYDTADVRRTENQRMVIEAIIDKVRTASVSDLDKYIDILFPEIYTGYTQSEILSLGVEALTGGWAKYPRKQLEAPASDCRQSGSADMWIWVVDYQKAAHDLQIELYGESNITLDADRKTFIEIYNEGNSQESSGDSGGTQSQPVTEGTTVPVTDVSEPIEGGDIGMEDIPTEDVTTEEVTGDTVPETETDIPDETQQGESGETSTPTEGTSDTGVEPPPVEEEPVIDTVVDGAAQ